MIAGAGVAVLACLAVGAYVILRTGPGTSLVPGGNGASLVPRVNGTEQQIVLNFLRQNLNDPSGMEIVEWGEPRMVLIAPPTARRGPSAFEWGKGGGVGADHKPGVIMQARFRAKNAFGATILTEAVFLVQNGKVVRSQTLDRDHPRNRALSLALSNLGHCAAERVGDKWTAVIVRGEVRKQGKRVPEPLWVTFNREDDPQQGEAPANQWAFEIGRDALQQQTGRGGKADMFALHADINASGYELAGVLPGRYLVTVEHGRSKTAFTRDVSDKQESQDINLDLK